ncbi:GIY-YIG nuclease family protein [Burkholderia glumae]|nr:GIY-YIG nuclease family protein [Burkholderia glumae]
MPGLVKIGYTTSTPEQRAKQLDGTHSPHPLVIEYSVQVFDARAVERAAHKRLRSRREGKEWFRCSRDEAINAIRRSVGQVAKNEFSRIKQEKQREATIAAAATTAEVQRRLKADEDHKAGLRSAAEAKYRPMLEQAGNSPGYLTWWSGVSIVACIGLAAATHLTDAGIFIGGPIFALLPALVLKEWADNRMRSKPLYTSAMAHQQAELDEINRSPAKTIVPCPCGQRLRLPIGKTLDATCPSCRKVFRATT